MIKPDKELRCLKCAGKAHFFYPFRGVIQTIKPKLERIYPRAVFTALSCSFDVHRNQFYVWEYGDEKSISYKWSDNPWLMNMDPDLFVWEKDSNYKTGYEICPKCGSAKKSTFDSSRYYYRVMIGDRPLVASTRDKLVWIRDFFASQAKRSFDPSHDFPKIFYSKREEIISKLTAVLDREQE